ncbi:hypothetical protein SF274771_2488 [Shigella flexneri 2747-71]|nr:hypothetical protein SF274771_2488 [Shigella flexneri 2747-71]
MQTDILCSIFIIYDELLKFNKRFFFITYVHPGPAASKNNRIEFATEPYQLNFFALMDNMQLHCWNNNSHY